MSMIYMQISGCGIFVISTMILGTLLRKYPSEGVRKITTPVLHAIALTAFMLPVAIGIGFLASYDALLGIQSLPYKPITLTLGIILIPIGLFFIIVSNLSLVKHGYGLAAFLLTQNVVKEKVYRHTRNPMSLGFYLVCLAVGLLSRATYFTLWILIEVIPAHIFYLKFFEEKELALRFGQPYIEYKKRAPFLIPNLRNFFKPEKNSRDV